MLASALINKIRDGYLDEKFIRLYGKADNIQRERYITLIEKFIDTFSDRDVTLFSAPGRSEVGGNHTDHNNGKVLACAVDLDIIAVAAKNDDGHIRVASVGFDVIDIDSSKLSPIDEEQGDAAAIVRGVTAGIYNSGLNVGGFDAITVSRVPAGSGLSSSAAFEVVLVHILDVLYNDGTVSAIEAAKISQAAERDYFGKPCGLMDQTACAVGGFSAIDFKSTVNPIVNPVQFDLTKAGYRLFIVNTGGSHANLTDDYAAIKNEMASVARYFGADVLRDCDENGFYANIKKIREKCGDRAVLRALHYFSENKRVDAERQALQNGDIDEFLRLVNQSGNSSFMYLQNSFSVSDPSSQGVSLGVALAKRILGSRGAARLHGGGFAGTIQAFVPEDLSEAFFKEMSAVFGTNAIYCLNVRADGPITL